MITGQLLLRGRTRECVLERGRKEGNAIPRQSILLRYTSVVRELAVAPHTVQPDETKSIIAVSLLLRYTYIRQSDGCTIVHRTLAEYVYARGRERREKEREGERERDAHARRGKKDRFLCLRTIVRVDCPNSV